VGADDEAPEPNAPPGADVLDDLAAISEGFCGVAGLGVLEALLKGLGFEKGQMPLWQPAIPSRAIAANA
jgi:hypothetical protein